MPTFALIMVQGAFARFNRLRRSEAGASVLEWALIAAVVVVAAGIIGAVIIKIVNDKSSQLEQCSDATKACGG